MCRVIRVQGLATDQTHRDELRMLRGMAKTISLNSVKLSRYDLSLEYVGRRWLHEARTLIF